MHISTIRLGAFLAGFAVGCSSADTPTEPTDASTGSRSAGRGSGGDASPSGGSGASGGSGGAGGGGVMPTHLPKAKGTCPSMANLDGAVVNFAGQPVTVWSGDPKD